MSTMNKDPKVTYDDENLTYCLDYPNYSLIVAYSRNLEQYTIAGADLSDYNETLVLPTEFTYDGETYPITAIGRYAFNECYDLKAIEIPDGYTAIGFSAFRDTLITELVLPPSITNLGAEMCALCENLKSVWIQNADAYNDSYDVDTWMEYRYEMPCLEDIVFHHKGVLDDLEYYINFPIKTKIYVGPDKTKVVNNLTEVSYESILDYE